jgi:DNA-binding response OmpR family regulator
MRVLVVSEDPKERLRATSALMLQEDAEVVEAPSVDEARQRLVFDGERFHVLVVDGDLYPRGGFAMLYDLRSRFELEGLDPMPALVMVSREQDRWLAGWAGANDTLRKPVDSFELARRVRDLEGADVPPYGDAGSAAPQVAAALETHGG